ncbi:hypothetical protein GRX03_06370 [Halovenus sp. WSH3]|uniref:Fibronectin-III type-like domain-containing protein n=1 Tax=Halovenus carboxidivorans TaxID=2692199 RepID=A0A6B0SZE1_9EURY|nr:hypothetical protein [Halovenus carboxidivorans]MXR51228.1 hypothetical protein [Halovenus carboxidivorans]
MNSALRCVSALLAICLLCGGGAPVGGELAAQESTANQGTITPNSNGTNYLSPITPVSESYERVRADASSAAGISAQMIHSEFDRRTFDEQLSAANQSRSEAIADAQLDRIETRFEQLAQRQEELHENQVGDAGQRSIAGTVTNASESLEVTLGLTHASGPLRVTVTDDSGAVSNATVRIDGAFVGTTDSDGRLWTIQPRNGFEVTAETGDGEAVSISFP